ncbi:Fpg/Nei family DNA glycosylase [Saccharopolyspora erythraea]|uniref:Fpg/Nei family DNA glycosylase n=1 Tax=Saccharopolyspora erythraea TaxID=1836 RepID=UPI001BA7313D|nr:DNA-formamidopyrimidine glycosylase family protein [Saccharopolyspora erythraea]QUH03769.1 Fpg/Nei family DNA glycosylase [Saccharopolyspora erythraea]
MPELPDVEGFRRVAAEAGRQRVRDVEVFDPQVVRGPVEQVRGRYLGEARRHGKWLVLPTSSRDGDDPPWLLVHFGMTGMLLRCPPGEDVHAHDRVVLHLTRDVLRYRDMRKLKGMRVVRRSEVDGFLGELGPDAAAVPLRDFRACVGRGRRTLKSALMDQSTVAGLGNLCVDEILWRARLDPKTPTTELDGDRWRSLHRTMRSVLRQAERAGRVPDRPSWLTGHRDDPGERCPRCSGTLRRGQVAGRTTVWCPACQRG